MSSRQPTLPADSLDPLGDYIASAGKLRAKLAIIAAHQRESAASLSRAAASLRAMAQSSQRSAAPENRNLRLASENFPIAST
jgi:hypothetical protein